MTAARRAHGQGTIARMPRSADGRERWRLQVLVAGRRHGEVFYGARRDAGRRLPMFVAEAHAAAEAAPAEHGARTVANLVDAWLAAKVGNVRHTTHYQYASAMRVVTSRIGDMRVRDVRPETVAALIADVRAVSGPRQAENVHVLGKQAFKLAVGYGWIARNPFDPVPRPKRTKHEVVPPSDAQVSAIMRSAVNDATRLLVSLAVSTGGRLGELLALTWGDIDLSGKGKAPAVLTFRGTVTNEAGKGRRVERTTKTGRARRITIDRYTADELRAHRAAQAALALAAGVTLAPTAYVFTQDADGAQPWALTTAQHYYSRSRLAAGCRAVNFHSLRHYAATTWLRDGVDVRTVAGRLGHTTPAMTLNVYAAFVPSADEAAAVAIGERLRAVRA